MRSLCASCANSTGDAEGPTSRLAAPSSVEDVEDPTRTPRWSSCWVFALRAVGVPFLAALGLFCLLALLDRDPATASSFAVLGGATAASAVPLLAVAARRLAPVSASGAAGIALLAALGGAVLAGPLAAAASIAAGSGTAAGALVIAPSASLGVAAFFLLFGGPLWLSAGAVAAARRLAARPPAPHHRRAARAVALGGLLFAIGAPFLAGVSRGAGAATARCPAEPGALHVSGMSAPTAEWTWFPLRWSCAPTPLDAAPSLLPTALLGYSLGALALGLAILWASRSRREPAPDPRASLFP